MYPVCRRRFMMIAGRSLQWIDFWRSLRGHSKLRNRAIANVFSQIGLIEAWGTGLQRIQNAAREYELPNPEFIEMTGSFCVNIYRKPLPTKGIGDESAGASVSRRCRTEYYPAQERGNALCGFRDDWCGTGRADWHIQEKYWDKYKEFEGNRYSCPPRLIQGWLLRSTEIREISHSLRDQFR